MPPEPILSASVPRYKRHCCSFNSFRKISYCCWVVIPSLYHISPPFGSYLRMSPKPCSANTVHSPVEWHREQWNVVRLPMLMHWLLNCASRRKKMIYDLMNTGCAEDGEPSNIAEDIPAERLSPVSFLYNSLSCYIV